MRPITISIEGDYYDSQIYNDRLYLWTFDGDLLTIDWGRLVSSFEVDKNYALAIECAFRRSDYLYGDHWKVFFDDAEIREVLLKKFMQLQSAIFYVSKAKVEKFFAARPQKTPFVFPHSNSDIYYNHIIVGSDEGLEIAAINSTKSRNIGATIYENDVPSFDISPSNFNLAIASGDDGAHVISLIDENQDKLVPQFEGAGDPKQISEHDALEIDWMFSNIFSSSNGEDGGVIEMDLPKPGEKIDRIDRIERYAMSSPKQERSMREILKTDEESIIWGIRDKLCTARNGVIDIFSYKPWKSIDDLDLIGQISIPDNSMNIEKTGSANFAFLLQIDSVLHVLQSDGGVYQTSGDVSNWRTFNRSKNYSNQTHAIFDDRIDIVSFNGDYFLDQSEKIIGLYHNPTLTDQKSRRKEYYI